MAFSSAPEKDTYSTHRIPLVQTAIRDRIGNAVLTMKNVLPYKYNSGAGKDEIYTETRNGILSFNVTGGTTTSPCRGFYVWEKVAGTVYYFVVVGTSVYTSTTIGGPYTAVTTLATNVTTPVRFTEFISDTNVKSLILLDGVEGFVFTTNAAGVEITDVDFPTPHVPFPVFLNGRLYVAKKDTGDIYCSDLNDPAAWTAGNFISSEVYPDDVQALVKVNNYILAIGISGSEYFYDAANATGSPLARYEGASLPFGTQMPNTIAYTLDTVCFLAKASDGEFSMRVIEGLKHKEIAADFLINTVADVITTAAHAAAMRGYFFRQNGHLCYAIARDGTQNSDTLGTLAFQYIYSFDTDVWVEFTRGVDTTRTTYGTTAHKTFPVYFTSSGHSAKLLTFVAGQAYNAVFAGYFEGDGGIDLIPINSASTSEINYISSVPTSMQDFGTANVKTMHRLGIDYTQQYDGLSGFGDTMLPRVSWSDMPPSINGYTSPRTLVGGYYQNVGGSTTGLDFPFITQLGAFRRRWILVECYGGVEYNHLEVDINKGQQ